MFTKEMLYGRHKGLPEFNKMLIPGQNAAQSLSNESSH